MAGAQVSSQGNLAYLEVALPWVPAQHEGETVEAVELVWAHVLCGRKEGQGGGRDWAMTTFRQSTAGISSVAGQDTSLTTARLNGVGLGWSAARQGYWLRWCVAYA